MVVKPLGSALAFGPALVPLFRQLGVYDDIAKVSLPSTKIMMCDEEAKLDYTVDFAPAETFGGGKGFIVSRPAVHNLFLSKVPCEKILFNKRILAIKDVENGVRIVCSDSSEYEGDIIVGADGANSAVRQNIYKALKEKGRLPSSDDTGLPYSYVCLVGQTPPLDPDRFPELKNELCQFHNMCGVGNQYTWATFTTRYNTICWMVVQHLDKTTKKDHDTFKTSEWGEEAVESMCKEVRHLAVPNGPAGSTLGILIDLTAKQLISKVTLEEKVFKTWYSERSVLLGDATEKIFNEYYLERYPVAVDAYQTSRMFAMSAMKNFKGAVVRFIRRHMPLWLWHIVLKKSVQNRPQASFLPLIKDQGTFPAVPQRSLIKTLEILAAQGRSVQGAATAV
ncbi:hypothetical protein BGZ83_000245 [Gryganskiella cystojenkinii]|nr:hypothetical protein BGZ83_000245 [Gryganskiella cystojenkinii]